MHFLFVWKPVLRGNQQPIIPGITLDLKQVPAQNEFCIDPKAGPQVVRFSWQDHARQPRKTLIQRSILDAIDLAVGISINLNLTSCRELKQGFEKSDHVIRARSLTAHSARTFSRQAMTHVTAPVSMLDSQPPMRHQ